MTETETDAYIAGKLTLSHQRNLGAREAMRSLHNLKTFLQALHQHNTARRLAQHADAQPETDLKSIASILGISAEQEPTPNDP